MTSQGSRQQLARDGADGALSDSVKKAIVVFLDGLIAAGNDTQEKAACRERLVAALTTYREGYTTSLDVVSQIFPPEAVSSSA